MVGEAYKKKVVKYDLSRAYHDMRALGLDIERSQTLMELLKELPTEFYPEDSEEYKRSVIFLDAMPELGNKEIVHEAHPRKCLPPGTESYKGYYVFVQYPLYEQFYTICTIYFKGVNKGVARVGRFYI